MQTTRRQFIKTLLATAAAGIIAPQVLVESVHGASDLTPGERDVAAEAMGLRGKQWPGADLWHPKTMRRTTWADGLVMTDKIDDWEFKHGEVVMFPEAKTELFIEGTGWVLQKDGRWSRCIDALNELWEHQFLEGTGDKRKQPMGILAADGELPSREFIAQWKGESWSNVRPLSFDVEWWAYPG